MSAAVLLVLGTWFSGTAVAPSLVAAWGLDTVGVAMLTVAVQLGFAAGALLLAAWGVPDVVPARSLMTAGAVVAVIATAGFALLAGDLAAALPFRFLTGAGIAAVYPVGMKVLAGWFSRERGLAVGTLIGAITIGSALPHLLRAGGTLVSADWRVIVLAAAGGAAVGAALIALTVREGPRRRPGPAFQPGGCRGRAARAIGPARQPWLPRPHVGAVRHVELDPGVPGRVARGERRAPTSGWRACSRSRWWRRAASAASWREPSPTDGAARRSTMAAMGASGTCAVAHRTPVRRVAGAARGGGPGMGHHGGRRFGAVLDRHQRARASGAPPARHSPCRRRPGSCSPR